MHILILVLYPTIVAGLSQYLQVHVCPRQFDIQRPVNHCGVWEVRQWYSLLDGNDRNWIGALSPPLLWNVSKGFQEVFLVAFLGLEFIVRIWSAGCRYIYILDTNCPWLQNKTCEIFNLIYQIVLGLLTWVSVVGWGSFGSQSVW